MTKRLETASPTKQQLLLQMAFTIIIYKKNMLLALKFHPFHEGLTLSFKYLLLESCFLLCRYFLYLNGNHTFLLAFILWIFHPPSSFSSFFASCFVLQCQVWMWVSFQPPDVLFKAITRKGKATLETFFVCVCFYCQTTGFLFDINICRNQGYIILGIFID